MFSIPTDMPYVLTMMATLRNRNERAEPRTPGSVLKIFNSIGSLEWSKAPGEKDAKGVDGHNYTV